MIEMFQKKLQKKSHKHTCLSEQGEITANVLQSGLGRQTADEDLSLGKQNERAFG